MQQTNKKYKEVGGGDIRPSKQMIGHGKARSEYRRNSGMVNTSENF